jgi:hypothetical protein
MMGKFLKTVGEGVGEVVSHKAVLVIKNYAQMDKMTANAEAKSLLAMASDSLGGDVASLAQKAKQSKLVNTVTNALNIDNRGLDEGVIQVQYNPSSIRYSARSSGDIPPKYEKTYKSANSSQQRLLKSLVGSGEIDFSFTLVFHRKYVGDQSVRQQMELILNMLYSRTSTKEVTFVWANMVATGRLISFSGKYDMFETTGNPMSGSMDMTIRLATEPNAIVKTIDTLGEERNDKLESGDG